MAAPVTNTVTRASLEVAAEVTKGADDDVLEDSLNASFALGLDGWGATVWRIEATFVRFNGRETLGRFHRPVANALTRPSIAMCRPVHTFDAARRACKAT